MSVSPDVPPASKSSVRCAHCGELVGERHEICIVEADDTRWSTLEREPQAPTGMVFHPVCFYAVRATTARHAWHKGGPVAGERVRDTLHVEVVGDDLRRGLVLEGEMDLSTYRVLELAVEEACAEGVRELVAGLKGLTFVDTTGIRALLTASDYCRVHDCRFFLAPRLPAQLERMLELMELREHFPVKRLPAAAP